MRGTISTGALRCSFCLKSQDSVQKLIGTPSEHPRAYICNECVEVCFSILKDDESSGSAAATSESLALHPLLNHPLTSQLLAALEGWIRAESLGGDAAQEFASFQATAIPWMQLAR